MVWYFIINNNNVIFNPECQIYINKCFDNHTYCALKEIDKPYKQFGCIIYLDFNLMKVYYENDIFKIYNLLNTNIEYEDVSENYIPTCSISDHFFPHHNKLLYMYNKYCPHKNINCHDRFCIQHNNDLISVNFPFYIYNHLF
ncbi:unknown similar to AMEV211 [Choristoneura rosaceana entomopoxvirus 'L']|uniref:Uncharacterized protein n=1 Tax=Choristoneura rosaceana entomopoxvirus 'L' TaxID=1293539 RepID=A0ABP1WQ21_9POXV|nr:unknown similar to AMEV211 [Choristoneura rosaceana entomopoxvirus 'L']CCU56109.1 unknown similar to AMEV211 [Choristoneura rosaceana entomopoxvirus 'L']